MSLGIVGQLGGQMKQKTSILVFCHRTTDYHKFSSWKQHIFMISQLLWVRSGSRAQLGPVLPRLQSRCPLELRSNLKVPPGKSLPPSLLRWLLATFSSLKSCCIEGLSSLLAISQRVLSVPGHMGVSDFHMATYFIKASKGVCHHKGSDSLLWPNRRSAVWSHDLINVAMFYWLEASYSRKGGLYKAMNTRTWGSLGTSILRVFSVSEMDWNHWTEL